MFFFQGYQHYEFSVVPELTAESSKLAKQTGNAEVDDAEKEEYVWLLENTGIHEREENYLVMARVFASLPPRLKIGIPFIGFSALFFDLEYHDDKDPDAEKEFEASADKSDSLHNLLSSDPALLLPVDDDLNKTKGKEATQEGEGYSLHHELAKSVDLGGIRVSSVLALLAGLAKPDKNCNY